MSQPQLIQNNSTFTVPMNQNTLQNTSGQGKDTIIPEGIKGWSWGAFIWSWIWAVNNRVWIGLIVMLPTVGLFMLPVLGIKGREWAWKAKKWESVEQFNKIQRRWSFCGVAFAGIWIALFILIFGKPAGL